VISRLWKRIKKRFIEWWKEGVNFLTEHIVRFLRWILKGFLSFKYPLDEDEVPDLAPVITKEGLDNYSERLELMLNRPERVKEIAVTGPYGSGKSTLLSSFEVAHPEYHIINVTLGNFGDTSSDLPSDESSISRLERAVLKQLLYRNSDSQRHGSRFIRIPVKAPSRLKSLPLIALLSGWVMVCLFAWSQGKEKTISWIIDNLDYSGALWSFSPWLIGFMLGIPIVLTHDFYRLARRMEISKFNPVKGELELQDKKQESVFNLYLEEVLSFFGRSGVDIVVFEDMDRFKGTMIFQRLKELNKVINDSDVVTQPVRFIYALKDDLFQGGERSKFFDTILPIVPVVAGANAFPQFKRQLENAGIEVDGNDIRWERLVRSISVYVQDMRLLKNIVSEFLLYKKELGISERSRELKLLAFMAYKNLHCDDFAKLQEGKGELAKVFQNKSESIAQQSLKIGEEITSLIQTEEHSVREILEHKTEIAEILLYRLSYGADKYMQVNPNHLPIRTISRIQLSGKASLDIVELLIKHAESLGAKKQHIPFITNNGQQQNVHINLGESIENAFPNYSDRLKAIDDRAVEVQRERSEKIDGLKRKQTELKLHSLQVFLSNFPEAGLLDHLGRMPLLATLLREAFIDEDYGFYLSSFVEGHLTRKDMELISALFEHKEFESEYQSSNYADIVNFMTDHSCSSPAVYNVGLLKFLTKSSAPSHKVLLLLIVEKQLIEHDEGMVRLAELSNDAISFSEILKHWPQVIEKLDEPDSLDKKATVDLLYRILKAKAKRLDSSDKQVIRELLNPFSDSLLLLGKVEEGINLLPVLKEAGVKFSYAPMSTRKESETRAALSCQVLALNFKTLLSAIAAVKEAVVLEKNSISFSKLPMNDKDFESFLYGDPKGYVDLLADGEIFDCPIDEIEGLLSDIRPCLLPEPSKKLLIDKVDFQVEDLEQINLDVCLLERLVQKDRLAITVDNISTLVNCYSTDVEAEDGSKLYFSDPKETLGAFFEREDVLSNFEDNIEGLSKEEKEKLVYLLEEVLNDDEIFLSYIELSNYQYVPDTISSLNERQLEKLINSQLLPVSIDMVAKLRELGFGDMVVDLLKSNNSQFFQEKNWSEGFDLNELELTALFKDKEVSDSAKELLLNKYQNQVIGIIPAEDWLQHLIPKVTKTDAKFSFGERKHELSSVEVDQFDLASPRPELGLNALIQLLNDDSIVLDKKLLLIIGQLTHLKESVWGIIREWGSMPKSWSLNEQGKLSGRIDKSEAVYVFCCALLYHELISSFSEKSGSFHIALKRNNS